MDKKERFESWLEHILVSLLGVSVILVIGLFAVILYHSPMVFVILAAVFVGGWWVGQILANHLRDVL